MARCAYWSGFPPTFCADFKVMKRSYKDECDAKVKITKITIPKENYVEGKNPLKKKLPKYNFPKLGDVIDLRLYKEKEICKKSYSKKMAIVKTCKDQPGSDYNDWYISTDFSKFKYPIGFDDQGVKFMEINCD